MLKFSQGPWLIEESRGTICIRAKQGILPHPHRSPFGWAVCSFHSPGLDVMAEDPKGGLAYSMSQYSQQVYDQQKANAVLIAESPNLLESLSWAMARLERLAPHNADEGDSELYQFAKSLGALNRARGKNENA